MSHQEPTYNIPLRFRKMENMHIVFWLLKDISWCLVWKPLGVAMIFPTLIIAIVITVRNRKYVSELCHNMAIVFWITANAYWMISEYMHFDDKSITDTLTYKHIAVIPFVIGIGILAYYYLFLKQRHKGEFETM